MTMATQKDMTLGEFLRHEREQRDITLEQVASATKVGVRTLHLLESDQYYELPAKPFIRGFVISYCRFIGLDSKEIITEYEDYINKKSLERPSKDSGHSGYAFDKKDSEFQSRTTLMIAMIGFLVLGGAAVFIFKPTMGHKRHSNIEKLRASRAKEIVAKSTTIPTPNPLPTSLPTPLSQPQLSKSSVEEIPAQAPLVSSSEINELPHLASRQISTVLPEIVLSPPETPAAPVELSTPTPEEKKVTEYKAGENPNDPLDSGLELKVSDIRHRLVFKMSEMVWVRYQLDDRPMRKFVVRKGNSLILRANKSVRFQISNPRSVTLNYNYQGTKPLPEFSELVRKYMDTSTVVFPKDLPLDFFKKEGVLPQTPDPTSEPEVS